MEKKKNTINKRKKTLHIKTPFVNKFGPDFFQTFLSILDFSQEGIKEERKLNEVKKVTTGQPYKHLLD